MVGIKIACSQPRRGGAVLQVRPPRKVNQVEHQILTKGEGITNSKWKEGNTARVSLHRAWLQLAIADIAISDGDEQCRRRFEQACI